MARSSLAVHEAPRVVSARLQATPHRGVELVPAHVTEPQRSQRRLVLAAHDRWLQSMRKRSGQNRERLHSVARQTCQGLRGPRKAHAVRRTTPPKRLALAPESPLRVPASRRGWVNTSAAHSSALARVPELETVAPPGFEPGSAGSKPDVLPIGRRRRTRNKLVAPVRPGARDAPAMPWVGMALTLTRRSAYVKIDVRLI